MSGTARLVGHKVEILADEPITGPTPTNTVMSYVTLNGSGYSASRVQATAPGVQIIPSGTSSVILFNAATIGTYLPVNTIPSQSDSTAVLAANQVTFNLTTGFLGVITLRLALSSSKPAFVAPPENVEISILINDNLGGSETIKQTVPITVFAGNDQHYENSVTVCFPTTPTRTSINIYCSLLNSQAADGIVITSGKLDVVQVM